MKKTILLFVLLIGSFTPLTKLDAQPSMISVGGTAGGGYITGNLPSQGSFTSSLFAELNTSQEFGFDTRLSFIYSANINVLFPRNSISYYPFIKGISIKGIVSQPLSGILFVEEGIGPLVLNDRTFSQTNAWDYGVVFSILAGIKIGNPQSRLRLGAGVEYGLTFTNTNIGYSSFHIQIQYSL